MPLPAEVRWCCSVITQPRRQNDMTTTTAKVARRKLSLLELAADLDNVSKACKVMGYSPSRRASSEGSGSSRALSGSSPITFTLPSSKACQKSGPFAPPALSGFVTTTTLSDSRRRPPPDVTLRRVPHQRRVSLVARTTMRTCRAHYPGGSKRVHVSIASPSHAAFP